MLTIFFSSIILIVIPAFLAMQIKKKIPLSAKFLSIGMLISIISYLLKTPLLSFINDVFNMDIIFVGAVLFSLTESLVRIYVHQKFSHVTFSEVLSIGLGYISLKYVAIFLYQFNSFTAITILKTQSPELLLELQSLNNLNLLYLTQIFQSLYVFLYGLILLFFIIKIYNKHTKFLFYEILFFLLNFLILLTTSILKNQSINQTYISIYFYFTVLLFFISATLITFIFQYARHTKSKNSEKNI